MGMKMDDWVQLQVLCLSRKCPHSLKNTDDKKRSSVPRG
ncbi:hypothetical protein SBA3_1210024 [Candidatus Sulfopaludibacter sp. SbA3]|nr:hypothetical protein SBA3_1210024 [Candidatus Sulfopaludibacter sp. SbA3]